MAKENSSGFDGFSRETFDFLTNLEFNNNKAWFEANKHLYQEHVLKPFQELVMALTPTMLAIDPDFDTRAAVGKTISRIYRDVRFSKDKRPYRSAVWLTFKRMRTDWKENPCFYFEINPSIYRYGMGFFCTPKEAIGRLRESIDSGSKDFKQILTLFHEQKVFTLEGEKYKRILDKSKPEELLDWYQRKDVYFMCQKNLDKKILSEDLVEDVKKDLQLLIPFYRFFWKLRASEDQ